MTGKVLDRIPAYRRDRIGHFWKVNKIKIVKYRHKNTGQKQQQRNAWIQEKAVTLKVTLRTFSFAFRSVSQEI